MLLLVDMYLQHMTVDTVASGLQLYVNDVKLIWLDSNPERTNILIRPGELVPVDPTSSCQQ